jgi:hypothetical protein
VEDITMPGFLLSARDREMSFTDSLDVPDVSQEKISQETVEGDELLIFLRIFLQQDDRNMLLDKSSLNIELK